MNLDVEGKGIWQVGQAQGSLFVSGFNAFFPCLELIMWKISSPDDNICKLNCVVNIIVLVPGNNRICTKAPVDKDVDDPYGMF